MMAVDLSLKSDGNNNNNHSAVDLSVRPGLDLGTRSPEAACGDTYQLVDTLMAARRRFGPGVDSVASERAMVDTTNIEMTALNLLCLARLQEILQCPPPPSSVPAVPVGAHYQTHPHNRKIFRCDYHNCTKVTYRTS